MLAAAAARGGDGDGPPPLPIGGQGGAAPAADPLMENLPYKYIKILKLMERYKERYSVYPTAESLGFYNYVQGNGGSIAHISRQRLYRAISYMKMSFLETVRDHGIDKYFRCRYLREKFERSSPIWAAEELIQEPEDDDSEAGGSGNVVNDIVLYRHQVFSELQQNFIDIAILGGIIDFINGGEDPRVSSLQLHTFLYGRPNFPRIYQDYLVDRILILKEKFFDREEAGDNNQWNNEMPELGEIACQFGPLTPIQEIERLSSLIWGGQNVGAAAVAPQNAGQDQEGAAAEDAGDDEDGGAGEDDLGGVEDS